MKRSITLSASRLSPLLLALAAAGCAFRTPTPHLPVAIAGDAPPPADLEVSAVHVVARSGKIDPATADAVRAQTTKILADAARKSATGDGPTDVRVTVSLGEHVDYADHSMNQDGIAVFAWLLMWPAGVKFERQALSVDVVIEREGRTFIGHGEADKEGSIYARARKRALAVALDRALADAAVATRQ
ncbi:MAG: hypothetical protein QM820_24220 [Minicystis sp.]